MASRPTQHPPAAATDAPLPVDRAFVVQLRAQTEPNAELFVGRAEHIASGAEVRFASAEHLIAFIARVLAPAGPPPPASRAATTDRENTE